MEKELDDKVDVVGEDEQSKLDSKRFEEIMGAVTSDVHEDVHLHHHTTDDDLHHLLPLTLNQDGDGVVQIVPGIDGEMKDEHVTGSSASGAPSITDTQMLSVLPGAGQTPEEEATPNAQKIVKRGRGGRRAGAGRKRKSDAAKAEAAVMAVGGGLEAMTSRTTTSPSKPLSSPSSALHPSYSTAMRGTSGAGGIGMNIPGSVSGGGVGALASNGPPQKKKKLSSTFDEGAESYKKAPRQLRFGKTILYVKEVEATVEFYERAFGLRRRFVHETKQYAELETGATALSFASNELARNNLAHVEFRPNDPNAQPPGMEIAFSSSDVHRDYKRALEAGAKSVSIPKTLPWGQVVAYVRDFNGVLVEIATELKTPLKK